MGGVGRGLNSGLGLAENGDMRDITPGGSCPKVAQAGNEQPPTRISSHLRIGTGQQSERIVPTAATSRMK